MKDVSRQVGTLENQLVALFEKVPHIPKNIRDILITIAPWCALIFGILGVISLFGAGVFSVFLTFATLGLTLWILIPIFTGLLSSVLALWSYPGLTAGLKTGWDKLFYSQIVSVIGMVLSIFGGHLSMGSLVGSLIGFYLLFEIRSHYK